MLPATTGTAGSCSFSMSPSRTSTRGSPAVTSRRIPINRRSSSIAITLPARSASATTRLPGPAPTSRTVSVASNPASSATRSRSRGSTRKFWPSRWEGRKRCLAKRRSRVPWSAGSSRLACPSERLASAEPDAQRFAGGSTFDCPQNPDGTLSREPAEECVCVVEFDLGQLAERDSPELGDDLRGVEEVGRPVLWRPLPGRRLAEGRVRLQQEAFGWTGPCDLPEARPRRACDDAREGEMKAEVEEALGPLLVEREVVHHTGETGASPEHPVGQVGAVADVHGDRQAELEGKVAHRPEPAQLALHLGVFLPGAAVQPDLAQSDDPGMSQELPEGAEVGVGGVGRVMPDRREDRLQPRRTGDRAAAFPPAGADRDQPGDARRDRLRHRTI